MIKQLKPCPRCGGVAELVFVWRLGVNFWVAKCSKCGLELKYGLSQTKDFAAQVWNSFLPDKIESRLQTFGYFLIGITVAWMALYGLLKLVEGLVR